MDGRRYLEASDMRRMGVGRRLWHVRLDKIPDGIDYKNDIIKYLKKTDEVLSKGVGMIIMGKNGVGKSGAAIVVAKEVVRRGKSAFFITAADYKEAVLNKIEFDDEETIVERARNVDLLIIDDLGKEYRGESGFIESAIDNLIRHRVQNCRSTIITTNFTKAQFEKEYDKSLVSLMHEAFFPITVEGVNWRTEAAEEVAAIMDDKEDKESDDGAGRKSDLRPGQ